MDTLYVIGGLLFVSLSVLLIFVNTILLFVLCRYKEFSTCTYRITKNMCFSSMIQLVVFLIGGIMTLSGTTFHNTFEKICGAVLCSTFLVYFGLSATLAFDRLLIFLSLSLTVNHSASLALLALTWIFGLAYFVTTLTPDYNFLYANHFKFLGWNYNLNSISLRLAEFELYYDFITLGVSLTFYVIIVIVLFRGRNSSSALTTWQAELRVLVVAVSTFLYELFLVLCGFFGSGFISQYPFLPVLFTVIWIVDCGFFAIVTLLINTSIRNKTKKLFEKQSVIHVTSGSYKH